MALFLQGLILGSLYANVLVAAVGKLVYLLLGENAGSKV